MRNVAWVSSSVTPKDSSPSFSASTDYIPRVPERTGNSVNKYGPNTQLTSLDCPDTLFAYSRQPSCVLYLPFPDSHYDPHSLCSQILLKISFALPSHSFAMFDRSTECLQHIQPNQSKCRVSAGRVCQHFCPVKHNFLSYTSTSNHSNRCTDLTRPCHNVLLD